MYDDQQHDRDAVRVGDAERDATIDALRGAVGDGRLTLDEFADRAGATYGASTVAELRAVTSDLPASRPAAPPAPPPVADGSQRVLAVMGAASRGGRWQVGAELSAVAVMGRIELDLYEAQLTAEVTTIRAVALMGAVAVIVPEGVPVQIGGAVVMGALDDSTVASAAHGSSPMIRVVGNGLWGAIEVRHREPDEEDVVAVAEAPAAPPLREGRPPTGDTFTLLFTDIVESTALAQELGDQRWLGVLREHNELVRAEVSRHGGDEVKSQGDGFMVAFRSARRALLAAIEIQRAMDAYRRSHPEHPLHVRIGLHTGEVMADDGDLHGRNVVLASRITAMAGRDEVLASALTKQLADAGGDLCFGTGQPVTLKGLSGDWVVHSVEWT